MFNGMPERGPSHRARLFEAEWVERFTFVSLRSFVLIWALVIPAVAITAWLVAPTWWAIPLALVGVVGWTFTEYSLHRYLFHLEPRSDFLKRMVYVIHGNHHSHPNDPLRNLMPMVVSLPASALIWLGLTALIGPEAAWIFLGFIVGYVAYDLVHFACHQRPMKGRIANALKVHHMRHHHLKVEGNYAITGIIWDRVFATRISSARKA